MFKSRSAYFRVSKAFAAASALLLLFPGLSQAASWWDGKWTARKKITVDATGSGAAISEPIGGATVLVRLFDGNFDFTSMKEDASDLRFVAEDEKTLLPFHVEKIDPLMSEAFIWVRVPDVKPGAKTSFWLYFSSIDTAPKLDDPKGSYDSDTALVFHFGENASQPPADSTKNDNAADAGGGKSEGAQIGCGVSFNGKNVITVAPSQSLLWTANAPMTLSVWVKMGPQPDGVVFSRRDGEKAFVLGMEKGAPFIEVSGERGSAPQPLQPGSWAHLAVIAETGKTTLFVNGERMAIVGAGLSAMNTPILLGGDTLPGAIGFLGEMDELQIHKVARPPGWLQLAALSQGGEKSAKLIALGEQEIKKTWLSWLTTGYLGVIVKNLTFDGWLVIIVLAIMGVISWYVMVTKVRYLNGVSRGNALFMSQWRHISSDLTMLEDEDVEKSKSLGGRITKENVPKLRRSSVYRIYHIGVEEIRHRLAEDRATGVRRGLAGRSIQAIRAALDGGLVHETQKINKLIVLLTICISGGPFLGLLGTVVGVMITFAAVAAAGEVNVNAIAPGIAAALLATVAGLAVAIPALFGYNYILSRVKDARDDMHIFIDEFVTKMAEFYKERTE